MHRLAPDLHTAEVEACELPQHLVVIAGDVDDMGAVLGPLHHTANDGIVPLWPVVASLHPPTINDVADQVERIAVDMVEKVDQEPVVAAACAEVAVRYPARPIAPPGRPRRAYALDRKSTRLNSSH